MAMTRDVGEVCNKKPVCINSAVRFPGEKYAFNVCLLFVFILKQPTAQTPHDRLHHFN